MPEGTKLDPIISEFETEEEAVAYEAWLVARVERSIADPRPSIPHEQVVAEAEAIISRAEARQKKRA